MKLTTAILATLIVWNGCITGLAYVLYEQNQDLAAEQGMEQATIQALNHSLHIEDRNIRKTWDREQKLEHLVAAIVNALESDEKTDKPSSYESRGQ